MVLLETRAASGSLRDFQIERPIGAVDGQCAILSPDGAESGRRDPRSMEITRNGRIDRHGFIRHIGLEACGGEQRSPTAHGARVVTAAFNVAPRPAGTQIAPVDRLYDFYPVGISAVVHQERGKGELDSRPKSARLQIVERQQIRTTLGGRCIVQPKLRIEVVFEDAIDSLIEVASRKLWQAIR